ncbi:MAG: gamma-glutamyltransferase [Alphaproteobacteria bacterium]|nr:gamma-glutamyltransferase [Alphaproteobacteria bacterium]
MVVAPQPEAVEAGCELLMRGGNAVDAAIGCALVQGVVDPLMTGIAGFGSLQAYLPGKKVHACIDFHGRVPAAARPDMWAHLIEGEARDGFGFILKGQVNDAGYQSITVPGSLKAYAEAHGEWGVLPWREVMAPAIAQAEAGWVMRPEVFRFIFQRENMGRVESDERVKMSATGRRLFFDDKGELRRPGSKIKNTDMAATLRQIADQGVDAFYTGDIARKIAADMKKNGALLGYEDLASYKTRRNDPLWGSYRAWKLATNQPPGGGIMLVEMLNILENFDLAALGHNTPEYIRVVCEAMKRATVDKDQHVGDPDFFPVPVDRLTDKAYARAAAEGIKRGEKISVPRLQQKKEAADTTHVSTVDEHGNCVTMTHSLGMPSGVITDGLGFMYNGCMGVFDPRPGRAGSIAPGKSRFSSLCPTIVFDQDRPHIAIGAPGGTQIAMGVLQAILNALDHRMTMAEAVAAPRFSSTSDAIDVANRVPNFVTRELQKQGYQVIRSFYSYTFAAVHGIMIGRDGRLSGGADPSRDGMALAV